MKCLQIWQCISMLVTTIPESMVTNPLYYFRVRVVQEIGNEMVWSLCYTSFFILMLSRSKPVSTVGYLIVIVGVIRCFLASLPAPHLIMIFHSSPPFIPSLLYTPLPGFSFCCSSAAAAAGRAEQGAVLPGAGTGHAAPFCPLRALCSLQY